MEDRVSISIADGIADVRLVRADKMNALDQAMFEALVAATERLSKEKAVRVVVLSGEGRAFCAGLDMGRFAAMKDKGGNGVAGGESRDLSKRTPRPGQFSAAGGVGLAATAGAGDCGNYGCRLRRRLSARARRRHPPDGAGCAHVDHGDQMGPGARHGGHADPGQSRARRHLARADLHRPHLLGAGSPQLRPCHPRRRRPARRRAGNGARDRRQEPACHPRQQAHDEQPLRRSRSGAAGGIGRAAETARQPQPDRSRPRQHGEARAEICGGGLPLRDSREASGLKERPEPHQRSKPDTRIGKRQ